MSIAIVWFRRDFRLADNPALSRALANADEVIPIYIHSPEEEGEWKPGAASRWWLHHSLKSLAQSLNRLGGRLLIRRGESLEVLRELVRESGAGSVYWNRLYEPALIARDKQIKQALRDDGLRVESCNSALWHEPWEITRNQGEAYRVFTPYWKAVQKQGFDLSVSPSPSRLPMPPMPLAGLELEALELLPRIAWEGGLAENWTPGEEGAMERLEQFVESSLPNYAIERDRPDHEGVSRLSPHLHFGEISPRQILAAVLSKSETGAESFIRELAWREFAHHLLYHFPSTPQEPMDRRFTGFPWTDPGDGRFQAWQRGMTGIPLVDAGMRELWHTGWMHNRVRMVAPSFLVKNLRIHWLEGARWFWDTLVDADLANNTLGWQWVAGCGADAAPYFRIFNPVLQGERFDPEGAYVRRWVPELAKLPARFIHQPWQAPADLLASCGIRLGLDYPYPLADLKKSREQALEAFRSLGKRP